MFVSLNSKTNNMELSNKSNLINQILQKVNDSAILRGTKKADGDLFFKLAFMSIKDLITLNNSIK